jgi:hypothetical protein
MSSMWIFVTRQIGFFGIAHAYTHAYSSRKFGKVENTARPIVDILFRRQAAGPPHNTQNIQVVVNHFCLARRFSSVVTHTNAECAR